MRIETEHLTEQEVAQFRLRRLTPMERRELDEHIIGCENCLRRVLDPAHSPLAFNALTEAFISSPDEKPFHLSQAELKRYNNDVLDEADRTIFESHLEICSACSRKAAELHPIAVVVPAAGRSGERIEKETKSRWRWPLLWSPARAVGIIAAVGCVLLILALWIQKKNAPTREQAVQTEQRDNSTLPSTSPNNSAAPAPGDMLAGTNGNESSPGSNSNQDTSNNSTEDGKANDSSIVVRLKDGGAEIGLDNQGKLIGLERIIPQAQKAVQTVLASESLPEPQVLDELTAPKINLMGQAPDGLPFKLITPLRLVVAQNRPTLRWQPLDGAIHYTVSVFDSDFNLVAKSNSQSTTAWTVPLSLQNGKVYSWEVTAALKDNQEITSPVAPAPRAQFKIIEVEHLNEIEAVRKQKPLSHLTLGVLYARAGLLIEAEREFRALLNENPQSNLAKKLLSTVRSWQSPDLLFQ